MKDKKYIPIEIFNKKMFYIVKDYSCGDGGDTCYQTHFYDNKELRKHKKKYLFFGPIVEIIYHKELFFLYEDIKTIHKTKEDIRNLIKRELDLLEREAEVKKGYFI